MNMKEKYENAEKLLLHHTKNAVLNGTVEPFFTEDSLVYQFDTKENGIFKRDFYEMSFDGDKKLILSHEDFTNAILKVTKDLNLKCAKKLEEGFVPKTMPVKKDNLLILPIEGYMFIYDLDKKKFSVKPNPMPELNISPDKKYGLKTINHNMYLVDMKTLKETQITFDGYEFYEYGKGLDYGEPVTGKKNHVKQVVQAMWSPDSKHFVTFKLDERLVKNFHIIEAYDDPLRHSVRPILHTYRYPLPEDKDTEIPSTELYLGSVDGTPLKKVENTFSLCAVQFHGPFGLVKWFKDSKGFYYTWTARGKKEAKLLYVKSLKNPKAYEVIKEKTDTFLNTTLYGITGYGTYPASNFITDDRTKAIWWSECDDLAGLFLYDLKSKKLINKVTGNYNVSRIIYVDLEKEEIYFMANCLEGFSDPYYNALCKVKFDGTEFAVLTKEDATHKVLVSKKGEVFVDTYSTINEAPKTVLRDNTGKVIETIAEADISELLDLGYIMPLKFTVTASDNKTTLYGIMVKPKDFDPNKKYPMIDYIYGGPQTANVPKDFTYDNPLGREIMGGLQEYAQLGFVGIILDGLGTPGRGKKIHDVSYQNIRGVCGLKDHVYAKDEMEKKFPFIDFDKVGMWGNSGGGCATSRALLEYPDFYKVGVSSAGNHDQRLYNNAWVESYDGLYDEELFALEDNSSLAKNYKGHLLIAHGCMDDNVTMSESIRLIDMLQKEDKDFDTMILPRTNHNVPANPYFQRRKMDYFVKHLLGEEPPYEYRFPKPEEE